MKKRNLNLERWATKVYDFIQELFEEEDEDLVEAENKAVKEQMTSEPQTNQDFNTSKSNGWNLLLFLDLVQCVLLVLPLLGHISSHWTIYYVQTTRELQQHIFGTVAMLMLGLFFLFLVFPKLMRVLLMAASICMICLPLLSRQHQYSTFLERYLGHVKSIPTRMTNEVQGHLFYSDQISDELKELVIKDIDHENIHNYLSGFYRSSMENDSAGIEVHDYREVIELYQAVKENWEYKSDPFHKEKFRPPHHTVASFSGDCDDYTLLICTLFEALGYQMRIIMTSGHVYPELGIPDKVTFENQVEALINSNSEYLAEGSPPLCYHVDNDGRIWLNLDYTAPYPGGPFMYEPVMKIVYLDKE